MTTIRLRGRREKGYILLLSPRPIDDKIKATFDRDSKSSRNILQRLCYALTISILFFSFFFFLNSRCPVTAAFSIAQIPRGNTGGETWNLVARSGKRSTTRTSLLRYLSIFHFEFYSIIGGVRARSPRQQLAEIDYRKYWTRSWQVHRWWSNRHLQFAATASFHLLNEYLRDNLSYAFEITVEYKILPRWIWSNLDVSKFPRSRCRCSRSSFLSLSLILFRFHRFISQRRLMNVSRSGAIKTSEDNAIHPRSRDPLPHGPFVPPCRSFLGSLPPFIANSVARKGEKRKNRAEMRRNRATGNISKWNIL